MPQATTGGGTIAPSQTIEFDYCNWRGERARRSVSPKGLRFGVTDWHPSSQWLLLARDFARGEEREFALADAVGLSDAQVYFCDGTTIRISGKDLVPIRLRFGGEQGWLLMARGDGEAAPREIALREVSPEVS